MVKFPVVLDGSQEQENQGESALRVWYQPGLMSPMRSRTSSSGLWELSGEQRGWAGAWGLAFYMPPVMKNRWNTRATSPLTTPSHSLSKQGLRVGLAAQPGHLPEEPFMDTASAAKHIPPSLCAQAMTTPCPEGNERKTEWADTQPGGFASVFNSSLWETQ